MNNKKNTFIFILFIFFLTIMLLLGIYDYYNPIKNIFIKKTQICIGILLSIFTFYFFLLPEKFIIGGLESNLICLDKIFFYDKKKQKQKYFLSANNTIIIIRISILLLTCCLLTIYTNAQQILLSSILFSFLFTFVIKILNYIKIKPNTMIRQFPNFIKKNIFYRLFLSSLITGLSTGISTSAILNYGAATGGTDVIFTFVEKASKINKKYMLITIDSVAVALSFLIDLIRKKNKRQNVIIKYIFSIFTFVICSVIFGTLVKKQNK